MFDVSEEWEDNNGGGKTGPQEIFLSLLEGMNLVRNTS
jgi:hypothetical protein